MPSTGNFGSTTIVLIDCSGVAVGFGIGVNVGNAVNVGMGVAVPNSGAIVGMPLF